MGHVSRSLIYLGGVLALSAATLPAQGTATAPPVVTAKKAPTDTVLVSYFRSEDSVVAHLTAGYQHLATLSPQDLKLSVRSSDQTQRIILMANVTNLGGTAMVARFTVQVNADGEYVFKTTGVEPGRDVTLRLTVPVPVKRDPKQ